MAQFEKQSSRQMYQQIQAYEGLQQQQQAAAVLQQQQPPGLQQNVLMQHPQTGMMSPQLLQQAMMQQLQGLPNSPPVYHVLQQHTASSSGEGGSSTGGLDLASLAQMQALQQNMHMQMASSGVQGMLMAQHGKHPMHPYAAMSMQMPVQTMSQKPNSLIPAAMNATHDAQLRPPAA